MCKPLNSKSAVDLYTVDMCVCLTYAGQLTCNRIASVKKAHEIIFIVTRHFLSLINIIFSISKSCS